MRYTKLATRALSLFLTLVMLASQVQTALVAAAMEDTVPAEAAAQSAEPASTEASR